MKILKIFLLSFIFLMLFIGSSVSFADDFGDGLDAYNKEDYNTAFKLWKPLADQGHVEAQSLLGMMYHYGDGVRLSQP